MSENGLTVQVIGVSDSDAAELAELANRLRRELEALDDVVAEHLPDERVPERGKGVGAVFGWLTVTVGADRLAAVVRTLRGWVRRNDRSVEVTMGGESLKLSNVTDEQQERIITAWLERHSAGV